MHESFAATRICRLSGCCSLSRSGYTLCWNSSLVKPPVQNGANKLRNNIASTIPRGIQNRFEVQGNNKRHNAGIFVQQYQQRNSALHDDNVISKPQQKWNTIVRFYREREQRERQFREALAARDARDRAAAAAENQITDPNNIDITLRDSADSIEQTGKKRTGSTANLNIKSNSTGGSGPAKANNIITQKLRESQQSMNKAFQMTKTLFKNTGAYLTGAGGATKWTGQELLTEVEGPNEVVWKVVKQLGSGAFGEIYLAVQYDKSDEYREVAIKIESLNADFPQLVHEAGLLKLLQGKKGVSEVYFSGVQKRRVYQTYFHANPNLLQHFSYNILVMELLSHSLDDLFSICLGRFSVKTALLLTDQLLCRLEDIHAAGFVHRDIKPDNFLLGRSDNRNTLYIIDFGLSKRYCDDKTGEHIPFQDNKSLTGTAAYVSINAHNAEQGRRDDLEALGYMIIYFLKGDLPWQGLPANTKEEKYRKMKQKKQGTSIEELCEKCPEEFVTYLKYVRGLKFEERPDYEYLKSLFRERYIADGYDEEESTFDWNTKIGPDGEVLDDTVDIENHRSCCSCGGPD